MASIVSDCLIFLFKFIASSNLFQVHFKSFSVALIHIESGFSNSKVNSSFLYKNSEFLPSLGGIKKIIFIKLVI